MASCAVVVDANARRELRRRVDAGAFSKTAASQRIFGSKARAYAGIEIGMPMPSATRIVGSSRAGYSSRAIRGWSSPTLQRGDAHRGLFDRDHQTCRALVDHVGQQPDDRRGRDALVLDRRDVSKSSQLGALTPPPRSDRGVPVRPSRASVARTPTSRCRRGSTYAWRVPSSLRASKGRLRVWRATASRWGPSHP